MTEIELVDRDTESRDDTEHSDAERSDTERSDAERSEVEPVELLVQLAEDGEIEPWDIDIVAVTDEFLDALDTSDLRAGGRALFYASVLLRMKSDALLADDEEDAVEEADEWAEPWEMMGNGNAAIESGDGAANGAADDPFDAIEDEMDRRLDRKRHRGTPQTLDELIRELRDHERGSWWKQSRSYDTSGSPEGFSRGTQTLDYRADDGLRMDGEPTETEVTGTAHEEDIETTIQDVYRALRKQYDRNRDEVLYTEIETAGGSRVETFLALLFLAHRGQIRLQQDELFGDLWIQNPATVSTPEEAIAD